MFQFSIFLLMGDLQKGESENDVVKKGLTLARTPRSDLYATAVLGLDLLASIPRSSAAG